MRPVILKTGTLTPEAIAAAGDFPQLFAQVMGWPLSRFHIVDPRLDPLPDPRGVDGIIITGSHDAVHDHHPWSVRSAAWLRRAFEAKIPTLGVCYGHQLIADAFGGETGVNPHGLEVGLTEIERLEDDPLFEGLGARFEVMETHRDAVLRPPPEARVLARSAQAPVQAMALGPHFRSVQWHPEFDVETMRIYVARRREALDAQEGSGATAARLAALRRLETGRRLMANFAAYYLGVAS
ncbi:glutamine amidotransferase [Myxococcota bacterium]|nr:glutamine amidotransferase [Myxococcota bacterium]MBU1429478.1 glutamine amidotransferase [Myxococcota bacterium]MBU1896146.1 glutamine amidotransferase [Myxococcota bacterium]